MNHAESLRHETENISIESHSDVNASKDDTLLDGTATVGGKTL